MQCKIGPDYKAILGTHVQNKCKCTSLIKREKREKPHGKKPSPKKRDKEDAWMDGVIKTPPLQHTSNIYIERKEE